MPSPGMTAIFFAGMKPEFTTEARCGEATAKDPRSHHGGAETRRRANAKSKSKPTTREHREKTGGHGEKWGFEGEWKR
jgi:hypothetical protein